MFFQDCHQKMITKCITFLCESQHTTKGLPGENLGPSYFCFSPRVLGTQIGKQVQHRFHESYINKFAEYLVGHARPKSYFLSTITKGYITEMC